MLGRATVLAAASLLLGAQALAQPSQTPYRCGSGQSVTYTGVPCAGGREVGGSSRRGTDKWKAPPQDRATLARRATLSAQDKQECRSLETQRSQLEAELKAKGDGATLEDEMPLVRTKKRYRELRC